jgi:DNA-binding NtrC family response regulator
MSEFDVTARLRENETIPLLPLGRSAPADQRIITTPGLQELYDQLARIGPGRLPVLIVGETGVGKTHLVELLAEHGQGMRGRAEPRARRPFVRIDCAASVPPVFERELEDCDGTVLFDEIGALDQQLQLQLLRAIEAGVFARMVNGSGAEGPAPRLVATTNHDLARAVEEGTFRRDLYHRIAGVTLVVPPLRTRPEDVLLLAEHYVRVICRERKQVPVLLGQTARTALLAHPLPGNARELRNLIELGVLFAAGGPIEAEHLAPPAVRVTAPERAVLPAGLAERSDFVGAPAALEAMASLAGMTVPGTNTRLRAITREDVIAALASCAGNQTLAATRLGMGRRTLSRWLDRLAIARPRKGTKGLGAVGSA